MALFHDIQTDITEIQQHYDLPQRGEAWRELRKVEDGCEVIEQLDTAQIDVLIELIYVISERFHSDRSWALTDRVMNQALRALGYPKAQVQPNEDIDSRVIRQLHQASEQYEYSDWSPQSIAFGDL